MNVDARRSWQRARRALVGACGGAILLFATGASANGMRCETKLVEPGYSAYQVRSLCGPPDDIQQRTEARRVQRAIQRPCPNGIGWCSVVVDDVVAVTVEEWTYDFGSNRFIQFLTFEAGKLLHVRSGPYGVKDPS